MYIPFSEMTENQSNINKSTECIISEKEYVRLKNIIEELSKIDFFNNMGISKQPTNVTINIYNDKQDDFKLAETIVKQLKQI
ncbi:TPA: hypothetical protein ACXDAY_002339 [Clostridium botulinum]|uniref:hypothetical protein n=1 Tax=Clostridium botulinum TaxID=1491 RepID=UPI000466FA98|nr:hypothetical protein [Clostridium botulinum]APR02463.1 hypothetical protein RSJ2_4131 [Clostridium botulinum]AUN01634.1 hypothetical protein RSJ19_01265 [Clostridium botulinum]MBN3359356.1 hypothetical protein [Clostridium botulinum]MBN3367185.1 hypothetical protein [Clostridium botulinum]MBN3371818.1 hypothetical protein [Clostridium botulinum]